MTKTLTIGMLLIAISSCLKAQNSLFGIKAGTNISTIGDDATNISWKTGFHGGIFSYKRISENLKLKPEFIISNQGGIDSRNGIKFSYWYLNAPLIIEYYDNSSIFIDFGAQIGTIINGNAKAQNEKENVTSQLENFDLSICLGFGYRASDNVVAEIRYNHGLTNTSQDSDSNDDRFPNQVFQLTLAYVFYK